jgi:pilus assembly protein CpaB
MRFVALLIAAVIAIGAGVFALKMSSRKPAPAVAQKVQPPVETMLVYVAREPIEVGTVLQESMIDTQPWPAHLVLDGFITTTGKDSNLIGRVTRASFQPNEPITRNKVANPNDPNFLAAMLAPGMRAITLAVDPVSGVAGYLFPGDRVDVILTHNIPGEQRADEDRNYRIVRDRPEASEVVAMNVRVLAVNARMPTGKDPLTVKTTSATLEVSEAQAQALKLAEKRGNVALALRPLKDEPNPVQPAPVRASGISQVESGGEETTGVKIVRGTDRNAQRGNMGW